MSSNGLSDVGSRITSFLFGSYSHARMAFRDLTYHEESDTGVEVLGPYQLHDLVQVGLDKYVLV